MSKLLATVDALLDIRSQQERLSFRKLELERQARQISEQTKFKAGRLLADATLALLSRGSAVDADTLCKEANALAHDRDRFALALIADWLDEAINGVDQWPSEMRE